MTVITANIKAQGFDASITHVVAADVPVLTLAIQPANALAGFHDAAQKLPPDTRNLILGCSAAVSIRDDMQAKVALHVLDGVSAAARLCPVFPLT